MIVKCAIDETVWTAAEAFEVTGVNPLLQRAWRNRGFLGSRRHARGLTSHDVAQLRTLKTLRDRGIDLEQAAPIADRAPDVLWFAAMHAPYRLIEPVGTLDQKAAFQIALRHAHDDVDGDLSFFQQAVAIRGRSVVRFVAAVEGEQLPVADLSTVFDSEEEEAAIILDLLVIGRRLAEQATRPLLTARITSVDGAESAARKTQPRLVVQDDS
ncbi:MerR family transcriptional regulator [uncultured Brevundimonas sp.]|jgi:MerR HTH family regulatory protein|uniref:MerR family transcriptional regulator n=1 Tax=uncultured Brevundimonas sp. TaxID=213418 RepID=UPI0025961D87|nr:MerR family transcriptional regulator [uncultured Brevundimonas sp.]